MRILQVSITDRGGGAEKVAWDLFRAYRRLGHQSWLAVGYRYGRDRDILTIPLERSSGSLSRLWGGIERVMRPMLGAQRARVYAHRLAHPGTLQLWWHGTEDFDFPGSWELLGLPPQTPEIVHCHNLHGNYFDLRMLPWLSQQVPVVLTLHDAWLLSGHCAHSFECERWKVGCGRCPDLTIYPSIRRDATAENWQRKQAISLKGRFFVTTPSRWLMRKVKESVLVPAIVETRVIPYGVDLSVFHPGDQQAVRATLEIPQGAKVLLFAANSIRQNIWKDYDMLRSVVIQLARRLHNLRLLFVALGEDARGERIDHAEIRFIPYQVTPEAVTRYYQAADIYVHAAKVDTFPNTILEALACGIPVVATAVGGIPEQVKALRPEAEPGRTESAAVAFCGAEEATGLLVLPRDIEAMVWSLEQLLRHDTLRFQLGRNAADDASQRFNLDREVKDYQEWYVEILHQWQAR